MVNLALGQRHWLAAALSGLRGSPVRIHKPTGGEKQRLLNMATLNAEQALHRRQQSRATFDRLVGELATLLALPHPLRRIEAYDVSHFQGTHPVGSLVVCGPEGWQKKGYRHFNLQDPDLLDDTARMARMLARRLAKWASPRNSPATDPPDTPDLADWPDLILLDGGRGQLHAALAVAQECAIAGLSFCAIAKGANQDDGQERLFLPHVPEPIVLPAHSPVLFLLQRIRDEAHRFAIGLHRDQRGQAQVRSALDRIPGIGPQRKRLLLRHFGSVKALREADVATLLTVTGVSAGLAQKIVQFFQEEP